MRLSNPIINIITRPGRNALILICIIFIAAFLRFYQLGINPPSLAWDEASWGYNAYALGIDGRDEFGRFLPHDYLESFGDFKPPLYAYLTIIPVKLFGLNEFSTRFASAFFGSLTVLVSYFLVNCMFPNRKNLSNFAALFLAISPWHILLSRAAFEANIATFFIITGVWLFLESVKQKPLLLLLAVTSFVSSIYTFNSARIVAPLLLICLSLGFYKTLIKQKKYLTMAIIVGILLTLPVTKFLFSSQASLRFQEVNIFSNIDLLKTSNQEIANDGNTLWAKIIHNRRIVYAREFTKHYFDNLNPNFLFIKGDGNPKFSIQDVGQMYIWDIPFFVIGLLFLVRKREKNWWIVPLWMAVGIIPAAFARETPHALRIEGSLPSFQILTAYGFYQFLTWLESAEGLLKRIRKPMIILTSLLLVLNIFYFLHGYFSHYIREQSGEWQYGYEESISYVTKVEREYDQINITNDLGRPYIYYLFYSKTSPDFFRRTAVVTRDQFGFVAVERFGKYHFYRDEMNISPKEGEKILYMGASKEVPERAKILEDFKLLNGESVLKAYTL